MAGGDEVSIQTLKNLVQEKRDLEKDIRADIQRTFPVGSVVKFQRGNATIEAWIAEYNGFERIKIRNLKTGKVYWVYYFWLIGD